MRSEILYYSDRPVAVTGAGGSMGRHYVERLAKTVKVNAMARRDDDLEWLSQIPNVTSFKADVTDPESLKAPLEGAGAIVHLAVRDSFTDWEGAMKVNVEGLENVVKEAEASGVEHFHHISTVATYGEQEDKSKLVTEDAPHNATNAYGKTKAMQEVIIFDGGNRFDSSAIRPANVIGADVDMWTHAVLNILDGINREGGYGNEEIAKIAGKLSQQTVRRIATWSPVVLGEAVFATIEIENAIDLSMRAMQDPRAVGEAFNAVDDNISGAKLVKHYLRDILKRPAITPPALTTAPITFGLDKLLWLANKKFKSAGLEIGRNLLFHGQRYSSEKAEKLLGHEHRVSFEESVARTAKYVQSNGIVHSRKLYK